jgi:Flp pilus assembly protein TadD
MRSLRRARRSAFALAILLGSAGAASGQVYPDIHPVPRTTDPAVLGAAASQREVHERFRIGLDAFARNDWNAARDEFRQILTLKPAEPLASTAHYDLGITLTNLRDYAGARTQFEAAIARDPDFLAARSNLVTVELLDNDLDAARKSAAELVARAPQSARALYLNGLSALRAGDAEGASRAFGAMLSRNPSYATAHYDLALAEIQLGRYDDAERELRVAVTLAPTYSRARFALGTVLLKTGKRSEARAAFEQVAKDSDDPELTNLAGSMIQAIAH